jgi:hypothetical protein
MGLAQAPSHRSDVRPPYLGSNGACPTSYQHRPTAIQGGCPGWQRSPKASSTARTASRTSGRPSHQGQFRRQPEKVGTAERPIWHGRPAIHSPPVRNTRCDRTDGRNSRMLDGAAIETNRPVAPDQSRELLATRQVPVPIVATARRNRGGHDSSDHLRSVAQPQHPRGSTAVDDDAIQFGGQPIGGDGSFDRPSRHSRVCTSTANEVLIGRPAVESNWKSIAHNTFRGSADRHRGNASRIPLACDADAPSRAGPPGATTAAPSCGLPPKPWRGRRDRRGHDPSVDATGLKSLIRNGRDGDKGHRPELQPTHPSATEPSRRECCARPRQYEWGH